MEPIKDRRRSPPDDKPWGDLPRRRASDWLKYKLALPVAIASVICSLSYADTGYTAPPALTKKGTVDSRKIGLDIRVEGGGWGTARKEAIESVLYAVADELMSHLPQKLSVPIVVTHTDANPIALYQRGGNGEFLIHLHAKGENWHLYVYEFAHELCHVLSNYDENTAEGEAKRYNQWFEETLCETASLFTLKSLAATWRNAPPGSEWARQADKLQRFYELLVNEGHRRLPMHTPLASWLRDNEDGMRSNPYLRDKNELVANLLLPLFDNHPEQWDAIRYLNLDPSDARNSLHDYLQDWYRNAPTEHKSFITSVLDMFHLGEVGPTLATAPAEGNKQIATADTTAGTGETKQR